jgi:hypothetical protein
MRPPFRAPENWSRFIEELPAGRAEVLFFSGTADACGRQAL